MVPPGGTDVVTSFNVYNLTVGTYSYRLVGVINSTRDGIVVTYGQNVTFNITGISIRVETDPATS